MRALSILALAFTLPVPLWAQGWIEPPIDRPMPVPAVTKVRTIVHARIVGRLAEISVEEWFRNSGPGLGEGDYLYPLSGEAVFRNFSLFQGDEELRGETMDAGRARAIYEEIVRRKKDPALIELMGHGLVRARVFPINPGETRKITLRYTQVLERSGDALGFRYAAGERFVPGRQGSDERQRGRNTEHVPLTFTLTADSAEVYADPFSPTHRVQVVREGGRLTVRPDGELHGDFALFLPFRRPVVGMTLATHRPSGEDGYFLLTLSPGAVTRLSIPRDVTVVLDVSGSMSGDKLEQAKAALRQLLGTLGTQDRFRLLAFANGVREFRRDWARVTDGELRDAREWVESLTADGGTNIAGALAEAFRPAPREGRLALVVFVTDGLPSVGEQDPERIAEWADRERGDRRVFAFGVGHDVNTYLLDRLSAAGRGSTQYVQPGENVERALGLLAGKIQHPVLTNLRIGEAPVELTELYPVSLPDVFAGEELVLLGRYRAHTDARGTLAITGDRAGRTERFTTTVHFPEHELGNDYIPRLWAARKIGFLSRQLRLHGHNAELVDEIRKTALRYGLLSEHTSYLVQEPLDVAATPRPLPAPSLAPSAAVGGVAVAQAEESRARRELKVAADLARVDDAVAGRVWSGAAGARHVAGRFFRQRDGRWVDLAHGGQRTIPIASYSDAYFALLTALPELVPYLKAFELVTVAGERVSISVGPAGQRQLAAGELAGVVRGFRGR
jgi:Ca-activated chloride channel family protein